MGYGVGVGGFGPGPGGGFGPGPGGNGGKSGLGGWIGSEGEIWTASPVIENFKIVAPPTAVEILYSPGRIHLLPVVPKKKKKKKDRHERKTNRHDHIDRHHDANGGSTSESDGEIFVDKQDSLRHKSKFPRKKLQSVLDRDEKEKEIHDQIGRAHV
eukprot:UC4_evm1s631